jgi:LPXTG-motif cell wall-anchored protein
MASLPKGVGLRLAVCLAVVLAALASAATLPVTALAQSAGDEQYADPLGGGDGTEQPSPEEPTGQDAPTSSDAPSAPAQSTDGAPTTAAPPGAEPSPQLPRTGADAALLAALGSALLGAGLLLGPRAVRPSR